MIWNNGFEPIRNNLFLKSRNNQCFFDNWSSSHTFINNLNNKLKRLTIIVYKTQQKENSVATNCTETLKNSHQALSQSNKS
jgi:hypothetical protein